MGLENGIILHTRNKVIPPKELQGRILSYFSIEDGVYNYEICSWRKCWNIRHAVILALETAFDYLYVDNLTIEQIKKIWKIIYSFNSRSAWEADDRSIWSYDEIHNQLDYDLLVLEWLISYLRAHPDARAEFYDSY